MSTHYPSGNVFRRAIASLRHDDLRDFAFKALGELGYRRVYLLARALNEPVHPPALRVPVEVSLLNEQDAHEYLAFRPETSSAVLMQRFAVGHQCFVARREGTLVSACWSATRAAWSDFLATEIRLAPGDVYFYDGYTAEASRGLDLAPLVSVRQIEHFRAAGYRRALRATVPENEPALRAHAKSGFAPVAVIRSMGIGRWRHVFQRPIAGA